MFLGKSPAFFKILKNRVRSRTRVQSVVSNRVQNRRVRPFIKRARLGTVGRYIEICHTSNEILRFSWVNESISQSANQPNRDPVLQSQKVFWRCSEGALWDVVICRRLGDVLFCGTVVFGNTEQPRHWTTETTPGRIQAQWRTLLEMCELLFMTFYLPRNWRSLRNCL